MSEIVDVLSAIVVVAGIFVLARSGSQGPALVQNLGSAFSNALGTAVGAGNTTTSYA